jgi:hypothetical protein
VTQPARSASPRSAGAQVNEWVVASVIFCVSTWAGVYLVRAAHDRGLTVDFYQSQFGPALMEACGRGFENPDVSRLPAVAAYLGETAATFDCASLPAAAPTWPTDNFQNASRYLMLAVAATWRIAGVSWRAVALLCGVLFGAVATLTYVLARLVLSRGWALLAFAGSVTATPNIVLAPQLRDYAKGPFLLAAIAIAGALVLRPGGARRTLGLATLAGAVIGIGIGFRQDLLIAIAPVLVALLCLVPPAIPLRIRVAAVAAFLATFLAVGSPIIREYTRGGNTGHVALLGLGAPFDAPLRVEPSIYRFAGNYDDSFAYSTINGYAIRVTHTFTQLGSAAYERAARSYLGEIAAVFPADLLIRTLAAIRTVPTYFFDTSLFPPPQVTAGFVIVFYHLRASLLSRLAPFAFPAVVASIIGAAVVNARAAWLAVLVVVVFAGASSLQFHERHFYYLQFVPFLACAVIARSVLSSARRRQLAESPARLRRVAVLAIAGAAGVLAVLFVARTYQQRAAAALFTRFEAARRTPVSLVPQPAAGTGRTLMTTAAWLDPLPSGAAWIGTRFVSVRFRGDLCGTTTLPIVIRYAGDRDDADLSESIAVPLRNTDRTPTTLYFAAYDRADESIRFRGVELDSGRARCIADAAVVEADASLPLLLTTRLGPEWREDRLYERLR